jgi:hypothetical protein
VVVWSIPCIIVAILAVLIWKTTHELDPYRPLESQVKPVNVEVVALDWKWLFIHPDYGIATVNQLTVPVGTPINFRLTSASMMNSFFIPQLGSQTYAMAGMQTRLHLIADESARKPFAWKRTRNGFLVAGSRSSTAAMSNAAGARIRGSKSSSARSGVGSVEAKNGGAKRFAIRLVIALERSSCRVMHPENIGTRNASSAEASSASDRMRDQSMRSLNSVFIRACL